MVVCRKSLATIVPQRKNVFLARLHPSGAAPVVKIKVQAWFLTRFGPSGVVPVVKITLCF